MTGPASGEWTAPLAAPPAATAAGAHEAPAGSWVLVERAGSLWGVAGEAVARLAPGGRLLVRGAAGGEMQRGELAADRVVAVVSDLTVRPVPRALARFWGEAAAGLAVYGERPVVLIDPASPPESLRAGAAEQAVDDGQDDAQDDAQGDGQDDGQDDLEVVAGDDDGGDRDGRSTDGSSRPAR